MKKVFVSLVVLMFAVNVFATESPIDKGSMILDGDVYFQTKSGELYEQGEDKDTPTIIAFMPSVGYFVAPSIMIGAVINFHKWSIGDYSETMLGFGPMVGYYFNMDPERTDVKGAIYPYIKAFFMYNSMKFDNGTDDFTEKVTSFGGQGGIVYMLSNAVAVDFGVLFRSDSWKDDDKNIPEGETNESYSGTVIQVGAGITAFFWN